MTNYSLNEALLRLFHVCVKPSYSGMEVRGTYPIDNGVVIVEKDGYIPDVIDARLAQVIIDILGTTNKQWQNTFHKSIEKISTAAIETLVVEQLAHYNSTYGMEEIGLAPMPMIPFERLNINIDAKANKNCIRIVRIIDEDEIPVYVNSYLKNVAAPNKMTMDCVEALINSVGDKLINANEIKSRELRMLVHEVKGTCPDEPNEWLRYAIYNTTRSTLVIKNKQLINTIKTNSTQTKPQILFKKADLTKLAEIFYRNKPLFLAFKANKECAKYVNKIRKLAVKYHKPMNDISVQNFSKLINENRQVDAEKVLKKASVKELIKLMNYENETEYQGEEEWIKSL